MEEVREDDSLDIDSESNTPFVVVNGEGDRGLGSLLVFEDDGGGSE